MAQEKSERQSSTANNSLQGYQLTSETSLNYEIYDPAAFGRIIEKE
jgi:hypothetical protein